MGKILSDKEKKLQKKLIPVNIFVCILSLIVAVTLFFLPILKIDFGKILRSEALGDYLETTIDSTAGEGNDEEQEGLDFMPVISVLVEEALSGVEGSISITAFGASKVAFAPQEQKAEMVLDLLFTGDGALIDTLADSLCSALMNIFDSDAGKDAIETAVVSIIASEFVNGTDTGLTQADIKLLVPKFREIENVGTNGVTTESVANGISDKLGEILGSEISADARAQMVDLIGNMYDETQTELSSGSKVTFESAICVMISKNVDLSEYNINDVLKGMTGKDSDNNGGDANESVQVSSARLSLAAQENGYDQPVCTTYKELLAAIGFNDEFSDSFKQELKTTLMGTIEESMGEMMDKLGYYGYLFYGVLALIAPWLILFLFSFFHMLAKNKRFMMWYVKLFGFIPGLFGCVVVFADKIIPLIPPAAELFEGEEGLLMKAVLQGITSFAWISGVCYVLLWLVSIFWAFPIKHKIRKERKLCKLAAKNGTGTYGAVSAPAEQYGSSNTNNGGYGALAESDLGGYNSGSYGADGYGSGGFDNSLDSGYGYGGYDPGGFDDPFDTDLDDYGYGYGSDYGSDYDNDDYGYGGYGSYDDDDDSLF